MYFMTVGERKGEKRKMNQTKLQKLKKLENKLMQLVKELQLIPIAVAAKKKKVKRQALIQLDKTGTINIIKVANRSYVLPEQMKAYKPRAKTTTK